MKIPLTVYRPVRTAIDGSFQEAPPLNIGTVWGVLSLPGRELEISGIDLNEDIAVGDILEISDDY